MRPLFTIGYEKATARAVIEELARAKVDILVDTRAVTASRRPGFSKRQLAAALDEAGIAYIHMQKLGTPSEGRQAARSGRRDELFRIYERHLATPAAQEELDALAGLIKSGKRVCLLCCERDVNECHRRRIAEVMQERSGVAVKHLVPPLF
ncbi:MAG: DUF488 domain-containing protein [Variibacter sp.]|nr:DUF488 domain-containing protein [Variibacter sp.]